MTARDRLVLIGVIAVAVVGVVWLMFVSPERKKASQAGGLAGSGRSAARQRPQRTGTRALRAGQVRRQLLHDRAPRQSRPDHPGSALADVRTGAGLQAEERRIRLDHLLGRRAKASAQHHRRRPPPQAAAADGGFQQVPFTFVFNGTYSGLEQMLRRLTNFATKTHLGRPEGQRAPADDPGRDPAAAGRSGHSRAPTPT